MAGHGGVKRTRDRLGCHFWWPGFRADVAKFCRSCDACQRAGKIRHNPPPAPLCPLPEVYEPFARVMIDCVGPLPRTKKGNEYLLTILDVCTRFPEAVPLHNIKTTVIVDSLLLFFSHYGLPVEV